LQVVAHNSAAGFLTRAKPWLEKAEAENNLFLGIAGFFELNPAQSTLQPHFATVEDDNKIVGAALRTPPRRLLMTRMPESAVIALADHLLTAGVQLPGVLGLTDCARVFADKWRVNTGKTAHVKMSERLYACGNVIPPRWSPGSLRIATQDDESLLARWTNEFCRDANIEEDSAYLQTQVPTTIKKGWLYVWDDGEVVSMAGLGRETAHGYSVSLVYRPSHRRNRGYAISSVAALTQQMLDSGKRFCCLFTDLSNATSNSMYRKIGYRPVCDVDDWIFT